jgi:hypothetical protein
MQGTTFKNQMLSFWGDGQFDFYNDEEKELSDIENRC